ncbi:U3 small nucleolar RNA-associated protein 6 homolog [Rhizoctonia solani]|uniref:U3 small nucleolar RNA-associated protein 6 homolog n=1 Tax=Rhizoctonia solani TaxID=456999 RepID=A0A0K6FXS6_9AGAM|nr:U3 small nucleolar RNA-associated protein 6 homolog [Rhizoctonia solani]
MLKYMVYYRHRKAEEALQAMQASRRRIRANAEAAEAARTHEEIQQYEPDFDETFGLNNPRFETTPEGDKGMVPENDNAPEAEPFPRPDNGDVVPMDEPPENRDMPHTPTPPASPPPLDIDYDSDESESDYQFAYAYADPPAIRLAYLNALSDHIVRKHPVRDVEISLRNTINCLRLTPNGLPPDVKPLTTLKSIRHHLGLDTSRLLVRVPVCDKCYKRYSMEDVTSAVLPATCTRAQPSCTGSYMKLGTKNGKEKKMPTKVLLYMKIVPSLRYMLLRPSFVRLLTEGSEANGLPRAPDVFYDICDGSAWKSAQIGLRRVFRRDGTVSDEPTTPGSECFVSSLGYGLFGALNIDWFGLTQKRSSGAIYLAILNLPRHARYQVHNVILACIVSGPTEPSLENLNFVVEPIVESFKQLYAGVAIKIFNENLPATVKRVYMYPLLVISDVPARSKIGGLPPHMHRKRIGCDCDVCQADLATSKAYEPENFVYLDEDDILSLSKQATESQAARNRIAKEYGIRWSVLNELPGWKPHASAPFDPMHCLYLGIVNRLWCDVIEDGYLLSTSQKAVFESFLLDLRWPSQIGRLPSPTTTGLNRRKADEWRRLISILPIALWISWRNEVDEIPNAAPPVPAQVSKKPTFTRNLPEIWECVVYLTASIRLFTSWIAYRPDIERAQSYMAYYCQGLLRLLVRLQPNHHYALHLLQYFDAYGPCYAWWLFPYERFNGILEDVELNGHSDDMDTSLARWWIRTHLLHNYLESLPDNASDEERSVLDQLCRSSQDQRGTLLAMTESLHGQRAVIKPSAVPQKYVDLRSLDETGDIYLAVLHFAQDQWPHRRLISDINFIDRGQFFLSHKSARQLQFIHRNNIRYGCSSSLRTKADQHAMLQTGEERVPVQILWHFQVEIPGEEPVICTIVARLATEGTPVLPWSLYSEDLGYYVTQDGVFDPIEAVSPEQLVSPVVTSPFTMKETGRQFRVVIAYDRTGCEIFDEAEEVVGENDT